MRLLFSWHGLLTDLGVFGAAGFGDVRRPRRSSAAAYEAFAAALRWLTQAGVVDTVVSLRNLLQLARADTVDTAQLDSSSSAGRSTLVLRSGRCACPAALAVYSMQ